MKREHIRRVPLGILVPLGIVALAVVYGACTPGSDITAAESDVVLTLYDTDFNFGSVKTFSNRDGPFSIPPETYESFENIFIRLDQIFVNADYAYRHDPTTAPQLPEPKPEEE